MTADLMAGLDATFRNKLQQLLDACRAKGLEFRISQGVRPPAVQAQYYCSWDRHTVADVDDRIAFLTANHAPFIANLMRTFRNFARSPRWLTNALPGEGWHQWGLAADCYCFRDGKLVGQGDDPAYATYAGIAKDLGLTAGFFFAQRDSGHVQLPAEAGATARHSWAEIDAEMQRLFPDKPALSDRASYQAGPTMAKHVTFRRDGMKFFAQIDGGQEFLAGRRVTYQGGVGLDNLQIFPGAVYDPGTFTDQGFWPEFLAATVAMEGQGGLTTLNTYDRARFTFGCLQYAAHVPNGDFVQWFRGALSLPEAAEWFPDLSTDGHQIVQVGVTGSVALENSTSTAGLMDYLNPSTSGVEDIEVVNAAKFIGWTVASPTFARSQMLFAFRFARDQMKSYSQRYNLDGSPDTICSAVFDIRHQGRGSSSEIIHALQEADPLAALLEIGPAFADRGKKLGNYLQAKVAAGVFGRRVYDATTGDFR